MQLNQTEKNIFSTVSCGDPLNFFENEETNYKEVSEFLEFDKNALSKLSGISKQSVRFDDKMPHILKERLNEIANVCSLVAEFFDGDRRKTALWFKTPNPMLGNTTPRDMIRLGRYKKLYNFIIEAKTANGEEKRQKNR